MVIIFIDMLLHKTEVYRHLLFNRVWIFKNSIYKLCALLLLFDVYIKWFQIEKHGVNVQVQRPEDFILRYSSLFVLCLFEFLAFHLGVRLLTRSKKEAGKLSVGLIISSFGKLLHILMVIWEYNDLEYSWLVNTIVYTSNAEVISIFFDQKYWKAYLVLSFGLFCKFLVQYASTFFDSTIPLLFF